MDERKKTIISSYSNILFSFSSIDAIRDEKCVDSVNKIWSHGDRREKPCSVYEFPKRIRQCLNCRQCPNCTFVEMEIFICF